MAGVKKTSRPGRVRKHRFGAHLSIAGGMHKALLAAHELGFDTVQVFVKNQRQWRATPFRETDVQRWHELLSKAGFGPVVAHASYLVNLASPDRQLWARSRDAFAEELRRCQKLAIRYLVVHPGAAMTPTPTGGIARVARALNEIFDRQPDLETMVLLETTAGQGTTLGRTFAELGEIITQVQEPERVGVCVDTCHVFAAGYDIRQPAGYRGMIAEAERMVGLDRIHCWHMNDSLTDFGLHRDRHAHIGHGRIGMAGFRNLLADRRFHHIPMILETPKGTNEAGRQWDAVNLRRLRAIAARCQESD
ncbi:MAG: deoxyribonuclease IV [Planctomycetota bacterium]